MNKKELLYITDLMYNRQQRDVNDIERKLINSILKKIKEMMPSE